MKLQAAIFLALLMLSSCAQNKKEDQDTATLEGIESPTGTNASLPYLTKGDDNLLYMSWVEKKDSGWADLKYSVFIEPMGVKQLRNSCKLNIAPLRLWHTQAVQ